MNDISRYIAVKTDQLNADDYRGKTVVVTFDQVILKGGKDQPVWISLVGTDKFYRPCKLMCRLMSQAWGNDTSLWSGRSAQLYVDEGVMFGSLKVGGLRISHLSHIDGDMEVALQEKRGLKKAHKVRPLVLSKVESPKEERDRFKASLEDGGPSLESARAKLQSATSLDELSKFWKAGAMAPFRADLQAELDALKDGFTANPNEDHGETKLPLAYHLACIAEAPDLDTMAMAVNAAEADYGVCDEIGMAKQAWKEGRK